MKHGLNFHDVESFRPALAWREFKFDRIALFECFVSVAANLRIMHEDVGSGAVGIGDKAKTFFVIEPFNQTLRHSIGGIVGIILRP